MSRVPFFTVSLLCTLHIAGSSCRAQDVHFSQFYESAILRNPALTGIFNEEYKAAALYRSQWASAGEPFVTAAAGAELRLALRKSSADYLSIGLLGYYDAAGIASLKTVGIYPAVNYSKLLSAKRNTYLSAGFTAGRIQRSYDAGKLTFDNEFSNGAYNPGTGSGEELPIAKLGYWDLGAGLSLSSSAGAEACTHYYIGAAAYHLTQPVASFDGSVQHNTLSTRWNGNAGINTPLTENLDLQLHINYSLQAPYNEVIGGALLCYRGREKAKGAKQPAMSFGTFYRLGDAVIPVVRLEYRELAVGLAYDVNVSSFKSASNLRGGLELTASFRGVLPEARHNSRASGPRF